MKKSVLIVDDHPLFREGLKGLVDRSSGYQAIGEAGNGREALQLALDLRPEIVTMDVSLPDMTGVEVTRELTRLFPGMKVLIVSMHPKFEVVAEAFQAGALGYVVKEATSAKLVQAMDTIARGEHYLDGQVSQEVVGKLLSGPDQDKGIVDEKYGLLTRREQQIMRLVAEGASSRRIAELLNLSPKTVENHRANLMKKLGVHNRMELVRYAARLGLIDVEQWKE